MATISSPVPILSPPPLPSFQSDDLSVPAALLIEGLLSAGRRLAGSTAARIGLGDRFRAGSLGSAQSRRLLGVLRIEGESRFRTLAGRLVSKELGLSAWAVSFKGGVQRLVAAGFHAINRGKPLSDAMKSAFRVAVARQGAFFDRFRAAIALGVQVLDGTVVGRAGLYAAASWGAAVNGQRRATTKRYEKRVLGITDHCAPCIAESNKGWQPIGTLLGIGETVCKARCACHFIYTNDPDGLQVAQTPGNTPPPAFPHAAPDLPVPKAPRKPTKPVKSPAPPVSSAPLDLTAARAAQRAANLAAVQRGVVEAAPRVGALKAEAAKIEADLSSVRSAYNAKSLADYVDARNLTEKYSAVLRDPSSRKADRAYAEGRLREVAPKYESLKSTAGVASDRINALIARRADVRSELAAIGNKSAVPYAELLKVNPDLIPPGPIADRLKAYTLGDAKVKALAALGERGREDVTARAGVIKTQQDAISDDMAKLVAEKQGLLKPYPGRTPVPPEVAARSRALQAEIGGLAARRASLEEDRREIFAGGVARATREEALRILQVQADRSLSFVGGQVAANTVIPTNPLVADVVLNPLDSFAATEHAQAVAWLSRVVARGDRGDLATRIGVGDTGRAYYNHQADIIQVPAEAPATTIVHEYGHALDTQLATGGVSAVNRGREFREQRVAGEALVSLSSKFGKTFGKDELGAKDKFEDAAGSEARAYYAGKDYGEHSTELLSMGLEQLYKDPSGFATRDPEWTRYVLGVLDGSLR